MVTALFLPALLSAQTWQRLPSIGSEADDRARLATQFGDPASARLLLRSPSSGLDTLPGGSRGLRWALLMPEVMLVNNSALPFSLNDGALWAGRGSSELIRAGVRAQWRRFSLVLAPELIATANLAYALPAPEVQLARPAGRNSLSTPWHVGTFSIDLPLRFGTRGFARAELGQSTLTMDLGAVDVGFSTENEWWGPGIRNAIVLSNNAPGIWRGFVRTRQPIRTGVGAFAARWFLGGLAESPYFNSTTVDNHRSISGFAATWTPKGVPRLTVGITRTVYAPLRSWGNVFGHVLDVLKDRGTWRIAPGDSVARPERDQMFALFGRWVFPRDGFALHAEWARNQGPRSLRDFLANLNHSEAYTVGFEWARRLRQERDALRVQAEFTYLEKSPAYRNRPETTWYTSAASSQGYTQRGQVIGAAIGPGASSQWFATDYFAPTWRVGLFGGRIRWDDDALYQFPATATENKKCSHDVSVFAGLSAAAQRSWGLVQVALSYAKRYNVFYEHLTTCSPDPDPQYVRDAGNTTLEIRFSPR